MGKQRMPQQHQRQHQGVLGHSRVVYTRRVGDLYAAPTASLQIDVLITNTWLLHEL